MLTSLCICICVYVCMYAGATVGEPLYGFLQLVAHLLVGWPAYLLLGATGGPSRGITNHFVPVQVSKKPGTVAAYYIKSFFVYMYVCMYIC